MDWIWNHAGWGMTDREDRACGSRFHAYGGADGVRMRVGMGECNFRDGSWRRNAIYGR